MGLAVGASEEPGTPRQAAWPSFLRGADVHEVYAHLCNGDPLRVRERSARRLRETWYLLEPDRVYEKALGVLAIAAKRDDPPADLEAWATTQIDRAIQRIVLADEESERASPGLTTEEQRTFPLLTESLYLDPELVRPVTVAFNALPPLPRRAFFELLIEGAEVAQCVERGPWDHDGLYAAIHRKGRWQVHALRHRGARLCALDDFDQARDAYWSAARISDRPWIDVSYATNLSCLLRDESMACALADQLAAYGSAQRNDVVEASRVIRDWLGSRSDKERAIARSTARRALTRESDLASALMEAYE